MSLTHAAPWYVHRLRVRYGECDPQGVVYNANYLAFLDIAFTEMWRGLVGSYAVLVERGLDTMLVQADLSFRRPARSDDELLIGVEPARVGATSLTLNAEIKRQDDLLLEARVVYVFVDPVELSKTEIPADVRRQLGEPHPAG
ncbi:MAG: acyl-CoA thioesterase [Thermoleophilia bacterium]|nr:acyl-CoA thioesterase [Thermoleophilia bacterium]